MGRDRNSCHRVSVGLKSERFRGTPYAHTTVNDPTLSQSLL